MIDKLFRALVWMFAGCAVVLFVMLVGERLPYPLELDYIEGVMMDHVVRLAHGHPIYVEPTLQFIPLAYMPMFATLGSLLARVFGPHFWEIRLISYLAMLGLTVLTFRVLLTETKSHTFAAAGAGLLLMAYGVTGGHYDVGRPDSLMLLLAMAGLASLRYTTGAAGALLAALLLSMAFFTKQHAAWFVLAALIHLAMNDRRRLVFFILGILAGCVGGYVLLSRWLGPWFSFYTWEVPSHWSQLSRIRIVNYLGHGLSGTLGPLTVATILSLALPERVWRNPSGIWIWAGAGSIGTGLMATLHPDAFRHVLNPTVVVLSVLGPLSLYRIIRHLGAWPGSNRIPRPAMAFAVIACQFLPLAYSTHAQRPHLRGVEAQRKLVELIHSYPGPVLMLYHGFYGWSAGKGSSLHQIALDDVIRARGNSLLERDPRFFDRMFEGLRHGPNRPMIITDIDLERSGIESRPLWASIASGYRREHDLGWISQQLDPINVNHWTPSHVYVPIDSASERPASPLAAMPDSVEGPVSDSAATSVVSRPASGLAGHVSTP